MDDRHLGDRAELYALGALDLDEATRVNAHAARCAGCAALVGHAERAIETLLGATIETREPPVALGRRIGASAGLGPQNAASRTVPHPFVRRAALAAGLLLALGAGGVGLRDLSARRDVAAQDDAALATIASAHFGHVTLVKIDPHAPTTKVLYGLSKRWLYAIVDSAHCRCRVRIVTVSGERDLGAPLDRTSTGTVFASDLGGLQRVEIWRDGRPIARATIR